MTGCKARNSRKRTIASTMEKKTATATHKTYCTVSPTCFQRWVGDNKTKERKRERDGVMRFERLFSSVLILSSPPSAHERGNHIACKWIKRLCRGKKEQNEAEARAACARGRKRRQKANVTKQQGRPLRSLLSSSCPWVVVMCTQGRRLCTYNRFNGVQRGKAVRVCR